MSTQEDIDRTGAQLLKATQEVAELEGALKIFNKLVSKAQRKQRRKQDDNDLAISEFEGTIDEELEDDDESLD